MNVNVVEVLDFYGLLNYIPNQYKHEIKINCPFHDEIEASLNVSLDKGLFYCFGCGEKGDIYDLVCEIDDINRLQAMIIASKVSSNKEIKYKPKKLNYEKLKKQAEVFFNGLSKPDWENINDHYMINRGFNSKVLKQFDVRLNYQGSHPIVIPLYENGEFKGYVCRREDNSEPKYLYNKGFKKNNILVGDLEEDHILIVEGVFDMMKAIQYGIKNVCATLGWSPSEHHLEIIDNKLNGKLVCGYDNDSPGEKGFSKLKERFGDKCVRFNFPNNRHDICELSRNEFQKNILKLFE
jgi:DNA primase